jgi:endonuclease YncB( thermonuclease family)
MTTWTVPAQILRIIDADTYEVLLDLGWKITYRTKLRLAGVNAPELSTPAGLAARAWVIHTLGLRADSLGPTVTVVSHSLDKYGRVLGNVYYGHDNEHHLNEDLVAAGQAVPM